MNKNIKKETAQMPSSYEKHRDAYIIRFQSPNAFNESNDYHNNNNNNYHSRKTTNSFAEFSNPCYDDDVDKNRTKQYHDQDSSINIFDRSDSISRFGYGSCGSNPNNNNNNNNRDYSDKPVDNYLSPEAARSGLVTLSDIVGSFGLFQFLILLFSGLRECSVGYDAVVMSVILKPIENFYCADPIKPGFIMSSYANSSQEFREHQQCYQNLDNHMLSDPLTNEPIKCKNWIFQDKHSLVAEWLLICDRHFLVALIESAYFLGLVSGNLVWGYYADKIGRRKAYIIAHSINLIFGMLSIFAPYLWLFAICRFFSAFGAISYNIIYSIQVELIGTKHRSFSTLLNHLGWGLGVILVPLTNRLFSDHHYLIALAPIISLIMYPWAFWLPESCRWLMSQERFDEAREELIRAAKFNGRKITPLIEGRISSLKIKIKNDLAKRDQNEPFNSNKHLYKMLFTNRILMRDTLILAYVSFIGHLFYYMLTINFGYIKNLSIEANFISSGAGEWASVFIGAILLKFTSRKTSLSIFLFLMASSFIFQFIIDLNLSKSLETEFIISLNNGIGTLSALLVVFVSLIVNQEVFPTVIRQTGSSVVNTIAESGSTLAPMIIQLARIIGPPNSDLLFTTLSIIGIVCVQFLTKTDDIELPDT